jgi:hypothetical protein
MPGRRAYGAFPLVLGRELPCDGISTAHTWPMCSTDAAEILASHAGGPVVLCDASLRTLAPDRARFLSLREISDAFPVPFRAVDDGILVLEARVLPAVLGALDHYDPTFFDIREGSSGNDLTDLYLARSCARDAGLDTLGLRALPDSMLVAHFHDDVYCMLACRQPVLVERLFARQLALCAREVFGNVDPSLPALPDPHSAIVAELVPPDAKATLLRQHTRVLEDGRIDLGFSRAEYLGRPPPGLPLDRRVSYDPSSGRWQLVHDWGSS